MTGARRSIGTRPVAGGAFARRAIAAPPRTADVARWGPTRRRDAAVPANRRKSQSSLFWFGLGVNIFAGDRVDIKLRVAFERHLLCAPRGAGVFLNISAKIWRNSSSTPGRAVDTAQAGNVVAITQQSLWGRVLNFMEEGGGRNANYRAIVAEGYRREGLGAFFTPPKWFARVLMNAPIQGTVPWFYNDVLPHGESAALSLCERAYRAAGLA